MMRYSNHESSTETCSWSKATSVMVLLLPYPRTVLTVLIGAPGSSLYFLVILVSIVLLASPIFVLHCRKRLLVAERDRLLAERRQTLVQTGIYQRSVRRRCGHGVEPRTEDFLDG